MLTDHLEARLPRDAAEFEQQYLLQISQLKETIKELESKYSAQIHHANKKEKDLKDKQQRLIYERNYVQERLLVLEEENEKIRKDLRIERNLRKDYQTDYQTLIPEYKKLTERLKQEEEKNQEMQNFLLQLQQNTMSKSDVEKLSQQLDVTKSLLSHQLQQLNITNNLLSSVQFSSKQGPTTQNEPPPQKSLTNLYGEFQENGTSHLTYHETTKSLEKKEKDGDVDTEQSESYRQLKRESLGVRSFRDLKSFWEKTGN